jgi:hypothetical protein
MCRGSSRSCTRATLAAIGDDRKDLWRMSDLYAVGAGSITMPAARPGLPARNVRRLKSLRAA